MTQRNRGRVLILSLALAAIVLAPVASNAADVGRPIPVRPEHTRPPEVRMWSPFFTTSTRFSAFDKSATGGGFVASGDVDGDGVPEIVVGAGPGSEPEVRIFSSDGTRKHSFLAYQKDFRGGVRLAVADTDGDGKAEIVTAPGPGIASVIHIFSADGTSKLPAGAFFAYNAKFIGGVHIAAGDLNGDGKAEIVTSPGPGGGPHVRVWNGNMENMGLDFFSYDSSMTDGVTLAIVRTPHGMSVVTAVESWSMPIVKRYLFSMGPFLVSEFLVSNAEDRTGVSVAAFDVDGDGFDEIAASPNGGRASELRLFDIYGTKIGAYLIQDPNYRGSVSAAQILRNGSASNLAVMPVAPVVVGPLDKEKFIEVNITQQRLYAYEHGRIARTFLISTGTNRHPTPIGITTVKKKIPIMDYRWSYSPGNPDNYFLPNVKYNLNVFPHIYIHSAYWHNNFGHRMSHGCINTSFKDAEWIFNWASVGTPVETHY